MKTVFKFLILASSLLFLNSCQDVVQIKLDEGSKLYVIDAFVNNLPGKQTIKVVTNDSYFSNRQAPPVPDAAVLLKDLTANKQYVFNYSGNGNYDYTPVADTLSRANHQYELNVTINGVTFTSMTVQKRTATIDSISMDVDDGTFSFGQKIDTSYFATLWAKDKVDNATDYYWVKTFRNDTLFDSSADLNICIDGTGGAITNSELDSIYFTPPASYLGFKRYYKGNSCKVEVHSISHDTYFFFVQAQAQIDNGGLFATTPENVKTNIVTPAGAPTKAIGWFNMATVVTKTKLLH